RELDRNGERREREGRALFKASLRALGPEEERRGQDRQEGHRKVGRERRNAVVRRRENRWPGAEGEEEARGGGRPAKAGSNRTCDRRRKEEEHEGRRELRAETAKPRQLEERRGREQRGVRAEPLVEIRETEDHGVFGETSEGRQVVETRIGETHRRRRERGAGRGKAASRAAG